MTKHTRHLSFILFYAAFCINLAAADGVGTAGPTAFPERDGQSLYAVVCGSCHMPNGLGATGAGTYPSFNENNIFASSTYVAHTIMYGENGMPAFGGVLDDEQIANIVNYTRTHFGNSYKDVLLPKNINSLRTPNYLYNSLDL